jgi:hypothetical protein
MLQLLPPQDGLSRRQLDLALLVAEQEPVSGLPAWPSPFPLAEGDADFSSTFGLRRVECMAGSHKLKVAELTSHLKLLQVGVVGYTVCVRRGGGAADPRGLEVLWALAEAPSHRGLQTCFRALWSSIGSIVSA